LYILFNWSILLVVSGTGIIVNQGWLYPKKPGIIVDDRMLNHTPRFWGKKRRGLRSLRSHDPLMGDSLKKKPRCYLDDKLSNIVTPLCEAERGGG
jgi:hypothetical protein